MAKDCEDCPAGYTELPCEGVGCGRVICFLCFHEVNDAAYCADCCPLCADLDGVGE